LFDHIIKHAFFLLSMMKTLTISDLGEVGAPTVRSYS